MPVADRARVAAGDIPYLDSGRPADGHHGTTLRIVKGIGRTYYTRVPTPDQLLAILGGMTCAE